MSEIEHIKVAMDLSGVASGKLKCDLVINNHSNEADLRMMVIGLTGRDVPKWEGDIGENRCIEKKKYVI